MILLRHLMISHFSARQFFVKLCLADAILDLIARWHFASVCLHNPSEKSDQNIVNFHLRQKWLKLILLLNYAYIIKRDAILAHFGRETISLMSHVSELCTPTTAAVKQILKRRKGKQPQI
jgi:hypothetical protein